MNRFHQFILLACICTAVSINISCTKSENRQPENGTTPSGSATAVAAKMQTMDAFSGKPINRTIFADHEGKRIYFCCDQSRFDFRNNPKKYLDEFAKQGVSLANTP